MWRLGLFLAGLTALADCGGGPAGPSPTPPALLLRGGEPSRPTPPTVLLSSIYELLCFSNWEPSTPPVTRAVFDFWLLESSPPTTGTPAVQAITNASGRIDYLFHVPIVRAEIDVDVATTLYTTNVAYAVFSVSNFSDHTIIIFVDYDHPETSADQAALMALGAQITDTFTIVPNTIVVTVADEKVPAILKLPHVTGIENNGFGCGAGARVNAAKSSR